MKNKVVIEIKSCSECPWHRWFGYHGECHGDKDMSNHGLFVTRDPNSIDEKCPLLISTKPISIFKPGAVMLRFERRYPSMDCPYCESHILLDWSKFEKLPTKEELRAEIARTAYKHPRESAEHYNIHYGAFHEEIADAVLVFLQERQKEKK